MKIKKLDESEQKEMQLENYKMLSALSGKSVNDLMGDGIQNNYPEKDCLVKQLYLKNCINPTSSKELWESLKKQGYNAKHTTFRGLLNQYQRYKYIKKTNDKKPFLYQVTEIGYQHIKNPYLAREEGIKRYREFQLHKLKEIIEDEPEVFKNIYESIHGAQNLIINTMNAGSAGSQYSGASPEKIEEYKEKINDDGFLQNVNEDKIKELIELGDPELLTGFFINLNDYHQRHKSSMTFKQQEYVSNKPVGLRAYYEYLVAGIDKFVTRSLYEKIPFRFIKVGNDIRLKSIPESGTYSNNQDGKIMDFDYVLRNVFQNRMMIKAQKNDNELIFFYTDGYTNYKITTMCLNDYNKVKNKSQSQSGGIKLKINRNNSGSL